MPKLHELLAIEADRGNAADSIMAEAIVTFSKKTDHFEGLVRTVSYLNEGRSGENTSEEKALITTVDAKLGHVAGIVGRFYDVLLQKETTNGEAKADLIVNGKTIGTGLPATFLLGMETRLKKLRELLLLAPTIAPGIVWADDASRGKGVFRSPPKTTFKTEKQVKYIELSPATDKHAAQMKDWTEDVNVARVDTTQWVGAWSVSRKAEVLDKVDELLVAVKQARQRANVAEVKPAAIGKAIFDYLLS